MFLECLRRLKDYILSSLDHTKQAAIMLMTGHTPKPKQASPRRAPVLVLSASTPARTAKTLRRSNLLGGSHFGVTPKRLVTRTSARYTDGGSGDNSSTISQSTMSGPRKSALKKQSAKKSTRKTESIKFDLSNLDNSENRPSDVLLVVDGVKASDEDILLHYSDSSVTRSPSPRRPIHSRSSRMLEQSLGTPFASSSAVNRSVQSSMSSRLSKSLRGSRIVEKALENSTLEVSTYSTRRTKSVSDQSYSTTVASTRESRTRGPRASTRNSEAYSIVDLVSIDANESGESVYGSIGSESGSVPFTTPRTLNRSTRFNGTSLLSSSTPYVAKARAQKSSASLDSTRSRHSRLSKRRSASLTTPQNSHKRINSTKISRGSKSRSRINDSDVLVLDDEDVDASPKSSRRISKSGLASPAMRKTITITDTPETIGEGTITPENQYSPEEASTPMLSIQNLLDQSSLSQSSLTSQRSRKRQSVNLKRKTIGGGYSDQKKSRFSVKSRSLMATTRRSLRARKKSSDSLDTYRTFRDDEEVVTPTSAVKPVHEGVKNKHSSAKKPQSKRSLIDNLDESDFVKQLFNSPVKRKLSQSMNEFSRKKLFEDDDDVLKRPTRNTIALTGRTPDNSLMEQTEAFTPELFVSPLTTPGNSPNLAGLKRLFAKDSPENDLRNVEGVTKLLRSPRTRRSLKNDLTDVVGVKRIFAGSPRNRLSDVRVKKVFASSPRNDLRRVSGVKSLFQSTRKQKSPKNTLEDVRGVKNLFKESPLNDLRNVSGVKKVLRVNSPRNDQSSAVRGLKRLYREEDSNNLSDVSGVEELFHEPESLDSTFDQLLGKPRIRSYTKSKSLSNKVVKTKQKRNAKSLHDSISLITENVEEWLQNELKKRVHRDESESAPKMHTSKSNLTRELQKLTTDTVEGCAPLLVSRSRNSTLTRSVHADASQRKKSASELYSAHTLPIKKRSLVEATNRNSSVSKIGNRLPIKKRMVVHSTPVKGRVNVTMNASDLGRVSPIAAMDKTRNIDTTVALLTRQESPKTKKGKSLETEHQDSNITKTKESSPKRTRSSQLSVKNADQSDILRSVRSTRRNTKVTQVTNTKKLRNSLVITKKQPAMSPKSNTEAVKITNIDIRNNEVDSPQERRSVRQKSQIKEKLKTPRNTRTKVRKISVIVIDPLAQNTDNVNDSKGAKLKRVITKEEEGKNQSREIVKTQKTTRSRAIKATVIVSKPSTQLKPRHVKRVNESEIDKKSKTSEVTSDIEENRPRRTRNANNNTDVLLTKKISTKQSGEKKTIGTRNVTKSNNKTDDSESTTRRKRGRNTTVENDSKPKVTSARRLRSKEPPETQAEPTPVKSTRSKRNKKELHLETGEKAAIPQSKKLQRKVHIADKKDETVEMRKPRRGVKTKEITAEFIADVLPKKRTKIAQNDRNNSVKRGKRNVTPEKIEPEKIERRTRNVQNDKDTGRRGKKNVATEEVTSLNTNARAGRRTRNAQNNNTVKSDKKNVATEDTAAEVDSRVGRTRSAQSSINTNQPVNRRGKKAAEDTGNKATEIKQAQEPSKRGRKKTVNVEAPAAADTKSQEVVKRAGRKRKVDVDEPTTKEAPAKRRRGTRAAALAEQAASGRSRRR